MDTLLYFLFPIIPGWCAGWIYTWVIGTKGMKIWERILSIPILLITWPIFHIIAILAIKRLKNKPLEVKQ